MPHISPGDSPQENRVFVEQHVTNDPLDTADRLKEVGTVSVWADEILEGSTSPSQFHIWWNPVDSDLAEVTLSGSIVL